MEIFGGGEERAGGAGLRRTLLFRRALLLSLLLALVLWGAYQGKFGLRFVSPAPGDRSASEGRIAVHPEVLNLQESFAMVANAVKPAVVSISTVHMEKFEGHPYEFYFMDPDELFERFFNPEARPRSPPHKNFRQRKVAGTGSGVLIDPDGFILTNEHVVRGADEIKVTLAASPDKSYDGKVIGRDERTDLAVVKIRSSGRLPHAQLGDSASVRVGDWAVAIGSPFGLEQTVTVGVISASRQNLSIEGRNYRDLIQTDAAINQGNSGGPLLNIHGEVIGINTAIYTPSGGFAGIGFAIPSNRAKEIIPDLRAKGKVVRSWIGVVLEEKIDDATASVFGVADKQGALVREVLAGTPAAKAGVKRGDVIREFDGKKIKDNYELQAVVAAVPPKRTVPVRIIRAKKEMALELTTEEAPASLEEVREGGAEESGKEGKKRSVTWLGAVLEEADSNLRGQLGIEGPEKGVAVVAVEEGSKAEEIGLARGDLVRELNQTPVPDLKTFREASARAKPAGGIVLDVLRQGEPLYLRYIEPE